MRELTVLMAVYNGEPYLHTAIDSILKQSYSDFTFLVIDDASTDKTPDIARSFADDRIQLVSLPKNVGQTAALNRGLRLVETEWMARMDADDYSAPNRFERQMQALHADKSLGCVGSFGWMFRSDPAVVDEKLAKPVGEKAIKSALLWSAPIIHGSIVVRTQAVLEAGAYDERYSISQDLDLYDRLLSRCRAENVPLPLLGIRRHGGQASHSPKALRETIEIFERRLSTGRYSTREAAVVRAGKHLHEALCARMESRRQDAIKHVARAFWCSPPLALHHVLPRRFRTGL